MSVLNGKVAIVTGAGRGIGRGIALELAKEGARIAVTSRTPENAAAVADTIVEAGGEALAIGCDVNEKAAIDSMVERVLDAWGAANILVNNAQGSMSTGEMTGKPIEEMTAKNMYANFSGGVLASLWAMQAVFPYMKEHGGRIINFSSMNGQVGRVFTAHYNAAKEGVRAITRTAAREWAKYGITVNVVSPAVRSDSLNNALQQVPEYEQVIVNATPLRALSEPAEAGRVIVFLASDDSRLVTGQTFMVDKGRGMHGDARHLRYPDEKHVFVGGLEQKWY